jgi:hypothetical protein
MRCADALAPRARMADALIVDPSWDAYHPILRGVITAILPFESPGFPAIEPATVEHRLLSLFPLEQQAQFLGLQRTLVLFDDLELFPLFGGPLAQEESKARDLAMRGGDAAAVLRAIREDDERAFAAFRSTHATTRFRDLPLRARRAALGLWRDSASVVKREFYGAMRGLVMVTMWSMDEAWPSIGYAGPLLPKTVRAS